MNNNETELTFEAPSMETCSMDSLDASSVESANFANMPEDIEDSE